MRFHKQQWARTAATVLYLVVASMIMVQLLSLLTGGGHQNVSVTLRSHVAADEESTEVTIPDTNSDIISQFQSLPPQAKEPASSASEEWPRLSGVQKVVVFSANANPFYSFYAPITAWAWKHLIGYAPVVLLSEDVHPFVLEKIAEAGGIPVTVRHTLGADATGSVMQTARILAAILPFDEATLLLTADVDMIPLNRAYFEGYDDATYQFHALNGKAGDGEYPICYMVARVAVWRQLMGYAPGDTLDSKMHQLVEQYGRDRFLHWGFDQGYAHDRVQAAVQNDNQFKVEVLGHGVRLDRSFWREYSPGMIDSHALRPGYTDDNWPRVDSMLFAHIMPAEARAWAQKYRDEYIELVRDGDATKGGLLDGMGRDSR